MTGSRVDIAPRAGWESHISRLDGRQLVLSGPGTGKTDFLAARVARLLSDGVPSEELAVLTFSRRAAAELGKRIHALLPRPVSGAGASTFHSFAHRVVEDHHHSVGSDLPILLTGPEQVRFVADLLSSEDPGAWPLPFRSLLTTRTFASEVADFLMRCHERLITPDDLAERSSDRADWVALPAFFGRYLAELDRRCRLDYGVLVSRAIDLVSAGEIEHRYVIVDEYQDTSPAQARLADALAGTNGNLTVAADPHQSIYSFRGADVNNVSLFASGTDRPVTIVKLERSFRVPPAILDSAERLVAPNHTGKVDGFEVQPASHTGTVEAYTFDQRSAEAEWIAAEIAHLHFSGEMPLSSVAVVLRSTRHLLPELSRALERHRLPHNRPGSRLVDHPAVRLIADVVTAATSRVPSEIEEAMRRIVLGPLVALPLGQQRELWRAGRRRGITWPELLAEIEGASGLPELLVHPGWANRLPAVDGFWKVWDSLEGVSRIVADPDRGEYRSVWATLARMLERQSERDPAISLIDWLDVATRGEFEASPQLRHTQPEGDRLIVTTLHQAKGLEFDVVFIADALEGVFPDLRRSRQLLQPEMLGDRHPGSAAEVNLTQLEEERRLAYTATTRARQRVVWTATSAGIDEGERRPSRFMLTAIDAVSFDEIGPPIPPDDTGFAPLTLNGAEAHLRRMVLDPRANPVERLAALSTLTSSPYWDPDEFAGVAQPGTDTGLLKRPFHLSPSQAALYVECPRRYALERRLRAVDGESPYMQFGSMVHEALELAEQHAVDTQQPNAGLANALDHLDRIWDNYPPFGPPEHDAAWRKRAEQLLERMYSEWPGGSGVPVKLEMELDMDLGGVGWVGRSDRIDSTPEGLKVIDYKTGRSPPTLKEAGESLQLGFYLLAALDHEELAELGELAGAELWYPFANAKRTVYPFDVGNLADVRTSLEEVARGVDAEDWTPRINTNCNRCDFREVCPAWPDGRESYR